MTYMFNSVVVFILLFYFYFWSFPPSNELLDCFHYCVMWNLAVHFLMICFSYWGFLNFGFLKYIFQNSAWLDTFQNWVLGHFSAITDQKKNEKWKLFSHYCMCSNSWKLFSYYWLVIQRRIDFEVLVILFQESALVLESSKKKTTESLKFLSDSSVLGSCLFR